MRQGATRYVRGSAVALLTFVVALAFVVATPDQASAHADTEVSATNWTIDGVKLATPVPGITVSMTEHNTHVRLRNTSASNVTVLGYSKEPYVRVERSAVFVNSKSPAGYINRSINAPGELPKRFDAGAAPQWRKVAMHGAFEWHDHRAHHGSRSSSSGEQWAINVLIDGKPSMIIGFFRYTPPTTPWTALASTVAVGAFCGLGMLEHRRRFAVRTVAVGFVGLFATQLAAQWATSSESFASRLGLFAYGSAGIVAALVAATAASRRSMQSAAPAVLFCAVAILVCGGLANISWLTHTYVPTTLPAKVAQAIVAAAIVGGLGLMMIAMYSITSDTVTAVDPSTS